MIRLIGQAIAQELDHAVEAAEAAHNGPWYTEAENWVAIAFVIFVIAVARPVARAVSAGLDGHADKLSRALDEARELREEAQTLLAGAKRRQRDAAQEAEDIIAAAQDEATRLADKAGVDLEHSVARRSELAIARIAQAEADVIKEVRDRAVDLAIDAAGRALAEKLEGAAGDAATDEAIEEVSRNAG